MKLIIFIVAVICTNVCCIYSSSRGKRSLIYPPGGSKIQFIMGFGLPVALQDTSVTLGTVFKCNYRVPTNSSDIVHRKTLISIAGDQQKSQSLINRWDIYNVLTKTFDHFGYSGKSCIMKAICQVASIPFYNNGFEIMDNLMHVFFTPSSTNENIKNYPDNEYLAAEQIGKTLEEADCNKYFSDCDLDVLKLFTKTKNGTYKEN